MNVIGARMIINKYLEILGKRSIFIIVLINLKKEIKEDVIFVLSAKAHILNAPLKQNLFN